MIKKNLLRIYGILCLYCLMISLNVHAQNPSTNQKAPTSKTLTVTGKVVDGNDLPLAGVSVKVKDGKTVTASDTKGNYRIQLQSPNDILVFTYIGFAVQEVSVANRQTINIKLLEKGTGLNEVVVVGYSEVNKKDLTGSVGQANLSDMQKAPVKSFDDALLGRVAGVQVNSGDGQPGSVSGIVIRGANSLTQDNSPLYVVDGFPLEDPSVNSINQSDIESIDILKDASATAIYGARGANGVIIITTKKGKVGAPRINYTNYVGLQDVPRTMEMMNPYEFVKYQIDFNKSGGAVTSTDAEKMYLDGRDISYYQGVANINYQDLAFRKAMMQNHEISLRGGSDRTKYSLSGNIFDQDGVVINSSFSRKQGRVSIDQTVNTKFKVGINANASNTISLGSQLSSLNSSKVIPELYQIWGYRPVSGINQANLLDEVFDPDQPASETQLINPILNLNNTFERTKVNSLITNVYGEYKFTKNLALRITGGINSVVQKREAFYNSSTARGNARNPNGVNGYSYSTTFDTWLNENILTYSKKVRKHDFSIMGGVTAQGYKYDNAGFSGTQVPNEILGIDGLDESPSQVGTSSQSNWKLASFLSRVTYNFNAKYLFTASFRADGSSKFIANNRWGYFPSASVAWRMSKEQFFKGLTFVDDAKLRFSYGVTGNNRITEFSYLDKLNFFLSNAYSYNNGIPSIGLGITSFGNPDLKWETTSQLNLGYDLSLWKQRLSFTADVYQKKTSNLLLDAQLPYTTGKSSAFKNIGKMKNEGLELTLNSINIQTKNFDWNSSFNISFNRSEVLELTENQTSLMTNIQSIAGYANLFPYIATIGQPVGQMFGLIWDGVYQYGDFDQLPDGRYILKPNLPITSGKTRETIRPGDIKYEDINGDKVINSRDYTVIGNGLPQHSGGFTNNFRYKGFDLNVFLQWSYGQKILNANRLAFEGNGRGIYNLNQYASYQDRWTPDNPSNTLFRAGGQGPSYFSSRVIEDGSYLRLKTVSFGYNLPATLLKRINVKEFRVYLSGQNLLTWTNYSGMDPEVSVRGNSSLTPSFDYSAYPRARTFTMGINLTL